MIEIWKPIIGYEKIYEISNFGRVKSLKRKGRPVQKIMTPTIEKRDGYSIVCLHKNKKQKNHRVHKLVLEAFEPKLKKQFINHKDGNKTNNNLINLEWCTPKENAQHCRKNNLQYTPKGEELPHSKLTENKVREIRELYNLKKYSLSEIDNMIDVGKGSVFNVVHNNTWRHIK